MIDSFYDNFKIEQIVSYETEQKLILTNKEIKDCKITIIFSNEDFLNLFYNIQRRLETQNIIYPIDIKEK